MAILIEYRPCWAASYHAVTDPADETRELRQIQLGPIAVLWFDGSLVEMMQENERIAEAAVLENIRRWQAAEAIGNER